MRSVSPGGRHLEILVGIDGRPSNPHLASIDFVLGDAIQGQRRTARQGFAVLRDLPNVLGPVLVLATIQVATAIITEATLSFLGVGVPVTEPSLGMLIYNGFEYLLSGQYWISFFPGIALALAIIAINLVGDHLRDVLNPRHAN